MLNLTPKMYARLHAKGLSSYRWCLYLWLYNKKIVGQKTTVYVRDFLKWYRRNTKEDGGKLSDRYASRLFEDLNKLGFAEVESKGFGRFEVVLFDYLLVLGTKKQKSKKKSDAPKPQASESVSNRPDSNAPPLIKQQQQATTNKILRDVGIKFDRLDLPKIARYGVDSIVKAAKMFKERSLTSVIRNPEGWMRRCLQCGWHKNWQEDAVPRDAIKKYLDLKEHLIDTLGTLPI